MESCRSYIVRKVSEYGTEEKEYTSRAAAERQFAQRYSVMLLRYEKDTRILTTLKQKENLHRFRGFKHLD